MIRLIDVHHQQVDGFHMFKQYFYMPFIVALGMFGNLMALMMIKDHRALRFKFKSIDINTTLERRLASSNYLITVALSSITVLLCLVSSWPL